MRSSYDETSGFVPVSSAELAEVNGGNPLFIIIPIIAAVLGGCANPMASELNGGAKS